MSHDSTRRSGRLTAVSALVASAVPDRMVAALIRRVYPRVEPELARIAEFVPRGGTALDIGGWYGPWTRGLRKRADLVVFDSETRNLRPVADPVASIVNRAERRDIKAVFHGGALVSGDLNFVEPRQA